MVNTYTFAYQKERSSCHLCSMPVMWLQMANIKFKPPVVLIKSKEKGCDITMQIEYSKKSIKYINSADKLTKQRLKEAIEKIPFGDIKKLQGVKDGYRLRVGDLRVLFSMEDNTIYIDNIIPRGQAYKRL